MLISVPEKEYEAWKSERIETLSTLLSHDFMRRILPYCTDSEWLFWRQNRKRWERELMLLTNASDFFSEISENTKWKSSDGKDHKGFPIGFKEIAEDIENDKRAMYWVKYCERRIEDERHGKSEK